MSKEPQPEDTLDQVIRAINDCLDDVDGATLLLAGYKAELDALSPYVRRAAKLKRTIRLMHQRVDELLCTSGRMADEAGGG